MQGTTLLRNRIWGQAERLFQQYELNKSMDKYQLKALFKDLAKKDGRESVIERSNKRIVETQQTIQN